MPVSTNWFILFQVFSLFSCHFPWLDNLKCYQIIMKLSCDKVNRKFETWNHSHQCSTSEASAWIPTCGKDISLLKVKPQGWLVQQNHSLNVVDCSHMFVPRFCAIIFVWGSLNERQECWSQCPAMLLKNTGISSSNNAGHCLNFQVLQFVKSIGT